MHMRASLATAPLLALALLVCACSRPTAAGTYFFDARTDAARGAFPTPQQVLLTLKPDGTVTLDSGSKSLLSTTWKEANGAVTFAQGSGLVGPEYRYDGSALIPMEKGKENAAWRFTKK